MKTVQTACFEVLEKTENMHRVVFNEEPKTGHGFEIGHRQQKWWRMPNVLRMGLTKLI